MASWGIGNFENDDAMDWLYDLEKSKGLHVLLFPIDIINSGVEYHEAPDCCEALVSRRDYSIQFNWRYFNAS